MQEVLEETRERAREKFDDDLLLEQRVRFGELFDLYAPLLTSKQRATCEILLQEDLSVSELGDELGVTRQGAHDLVRRTRGHLEKIEADLGLKRLLDDLGAVADVLAQYRDTLPPDFLDALANADKSGRLTKRRALDV